MLKTLKHALVAVWTACAVLAAVPANAQTATAPHTVDIKNFAFEPKELTVTQGTEIVWTNRDEEPHTVTSSDDPKAFKSPPLDGKDTFSFVFTKPGTYKYYCSVHPHMMGTITVK